VVKTEVAGPRIFRAGSKHFRFSFHLRPTLFLAPMETPRKAEFIGKKRLLGVKLLTSILASAAFFKI
jgi:hypothetical protein